MLDFIKEHIILLCWFTFVLLVYLYALLDHLYYKYNFKDKVSQIYDALTEEEQFE